MRKAITIVAPHPDDEIIGCYEALSKSKWSAVYYVEKVSKSREEEALRISDILDVWSLDFFRGNYNSLRKKIKSIKEVTYYFPDPVYETHPAHRMIGAIGEEFLRKGWDVVFYSINMQAPYIHEVKNSGDKERCLDYLYYSERSLWEHEKKYTLFEGYCKWIV
jgi:hypothetical protein